VDLCKVNIEGGEYDLFDRLIETVWLARIRILLIQFHEWHPNAYARRRAIRRAFSRTHDEVWDYPFVWEMWRRRT
ncbi:MAG: FkbM family methyltransferase, partial [Acidimicrobiia bacterium]